MPNTASHHHHSSRPAPSPRPHPPPTAQSLVKPALEPDLLARAPINPIPSRAGLTPYPLNSQQALSSSEL
ncbi:hypothetical protein CALCODRAFT_503185 [Calocera cornea HHB12733]|uniref:Uncharacterized protein n=1 Tax=Calocera cornea HHB12733 TaxID=1353952 RepID=A0A165CZ87_9BASI|nr:hypothetical protein CALCODRAFT_503185 [Calocera cornea HHB12733]